MIDLHQNMVSWLSLILPTYYELNLTNKCKTPCISYMLRNDYTQMQGDTVRYSVISYQIKVWSTQLEDLQNYSIQIDEKLREHGFRRISSGELYDINSAMKQRILVYEARVYEND